MDDLGSEILKHLVTLIAGSIIVYVKKMVRDVNASFRKLRDLEKRVNTLEKGQRDGSGIEEKRGKEARGKGSS